MNDQPFTKFAEVWPRCGEVSQAIYTATRPFVNPIVEETGLTQPGAVQTLLVARAIEPEALAPERIWQQRPYESLEGRVQLVITLAERQLLETQGNGSYRLTPGGRALITRLLKEFYAGLAGIEKTIEPVFSATDAGRLAALLNKIVAACFDAPIDRSGLKDSHGLAPNGSATTLARIDQALDDLNAFREDAHLAAWRPLQVAGEAWELFTLLWRGDVKNADEMADKTAFRWHSRETYQSALEDLIGRGWIRAAGEGTFAVTEIGRKVREEAELATDRNFYTPWHVLSDVEVDELNDLLTRLKRALTPTLEAVPA